MSSNRSLSVINPSSSINATWFSLTDFLHFLFVSCPLVLVSRHLVPWYPFCLSRHIHHGFAKQVRETFSFMMAIFKHILHSKALIALLGYYLLKWHIPWQVQLTICLLSGIPPFIYLTYSFSCDPSLLFTVSYCFLSLDPFLLFHRICPLSFQ